MEELGAELKAAREFQGMTLEDIHHITKISMKFLKALEEGDYDILSPVYIRAFLKAYAEAVGIQPEKVLKAYEVKAVKPEPEEPKIVEPVKPHKNFAEYTAPALSWMEHNSRILLYAAGAIVTIVIILIVVFSSSKGKAPVSSDDTVAVAEAPQDGLNLTVTAQEPVYLMVSIDDGDSLDYHLLADARKEFRAKRKIWALASDAGAIKIRTGKEEHAALADKGWSAHFVVDSTGLKVLKTYRPLSDAR